MRQKKSKKYSILHLLRSYSWLIFWLILLSVLSNGANLAIPKIVAHSIDAYSAGDFQVLQTIFELSLLGIAIFIFTYLQSIVQVYTSEKVALDLRTQLIRKIAQQNYSYVQNVTSAKLLTHLTSDVDAVKNFVAQSISSVISSVFIVF